MFPVASCNCTNRPSDASWPTFTILPSLTAITGDPGFAKIEIPLRFGFEFTGHPNLTRLLMYPEFVGFPPGA